MLIFGSCHCRNLSFQLNWLPEHAPIPARACTCSFCTRHGGVWTASATASLVVDVRDAKSVSGYSFATRTALFHVCTSCGIVPVVTSRIDGQLYAAVNVNTFDNIEASLLQRAPMTFDGEDEATRLARRIRNWIPKVSFSASDLQPERNRLQPLHRRPWTDADS